MKNKAHPVCTFMNLHIHAHKDCHEITHMHTHKEWHVITLVRKGVMKDKGHPLLGLKRVEQEENIHIYTYTRASSIPIYCVCIVMNNILGIINFET